SRHTSFSRDWSSDVCSSDLSLRRWTGGASHGVSGGGQGSRRECRGRRDPRGRGTRGPGAEARGSSRPEGAGPRRGGGAGEGRPRSEERRGGTGGVRRGVRRV